MARNGSGVYSLPAGSTIVNGDVSDASDLNSPLQDLETDMNTARPIVAGGTGATSAAAALLNFGLTATAAEINTLDGITASVTELNVLDGIPATLTATELGYVDGVTSAIQTQLNAKQATITTLPLANGGTGAALVDPNADRILFWDDSAGAIAFLTPSTGTAISGTNLTATSSTTVGLLTTTGATTVGPWDIPAGTTRIRVTSNKSSLSGTNQMLVQLRVGGSFVTSGYESYSIAVSGTNQTSTAGMVIAVSANVNFFLGSMEFQLHDPAGDIWVATHTGSVATGAETAVGGGRIDLSGAVDGIRIISSGADTFDVSSWNVHYS